MTNREKVIEGLNYCTHTDGVECPNCPYWHNDDCVEMLNADVLSLLKEREAVVPYIDIDEAKCPICKVRLTRQELIGEDVLFEDFFDYCPHCGRKVKWDD